jgi:hypothetical protein
MAAQIGTDIAKKHFARVDADANLKSRPTLTLPLSIQFFQSLNHLQGRARGQLRVIRLGQASSIPLNARPDRSCR